MLPFCLARVKKEHGKYHDVFSAWGEFFPFPKKSSCNPIFGRDIRREWDDGLCEMRKISNEMSRGFKKTVDISGMDHIVNAVHCNG
jgi:hypothetical protein